MWVGDAKVAAVGINVSRWVTSHGLALNVSTDLAAFDRIVPCGVQGKAVSSLQHFCPGVTVEEVLPVMLRSFERSFSLTCAVQEGDAARVAQWMGCAGLYDEAALG